MSTNSSSSKESPLASILSILFNILLPVIILNKLTDKWGGDHGPLYTLLLALSLPIVYGLFDYYKNQQKNLLSLFGCINIVATGGLALLQLEGIWFAVKEALFPLLIGIAVLISAYTKKPLIDLIASNILNIHLIHQSIEENGKTRQLKTLFKNSTLIFALSFFLSSFLNFILAMWIFQDIDPAISSTEKAAILNAQVSKMTWMGYVVIALPLTFIMIFNLWYLIRGIKKLTQLSLNEILQEKHKF